MNGVRTTADLVCVTACAVLLIMTVISIIETQQLSYNVNTGLFCAFFCLVPMLFRRAKFFELPLTMVILIEVAIFLHGYGVLFMEYDSIQYWDTVTHSFSSITVAFCAFYALMAISFFDPMARFSRKWMPLFIFIVVVAFGAYWESFEFAVDNMWGTNMQYSPWDTIRDLICDVGGALLVAVYAHLYLKTRSREEFIEKLKIHPRLGRIAKSRG